MGKHPITRARLKAMNPEFRFDFNSESRLGQDGSEDGVTHWSLTGHATIFESEVDLLDEGATDAEDGYWEVPIFVMVGVALRLGDPGTNLASWLDGESSDFSEFIPMLDGNDLSPDLQEFSDFILGSDLVIVDRAGLEPGWRGHGLGRLFIGLGLDRHLSGARAIATLPCPVELLDEHGENREHPVFVSGLVSVRRTWESLGFFHFSGDVWVKDPSIGAGAEHLGMLRARLLGR